MHSFRKKTIWQIKQRSSTVATAKLVKLSYDLLVHPLYSILLCRPSENVFFRRVKEFEVSLGQMYQAKEDCIKKLIAIFPPHFYCFLYSRSTYGIALVSNDLVSLG